MLSCKWWNNKASDVKLVYRYSTIKYYKFVSENIIWLQLVQCPTQSNETNLEIYRESMTRYSPSAADLPQIILHICVLLLFGPKGNLSFALTFKCRAQCTLICSTRIWLTVYRSPLSSDIIVTFYMTPLSNALNKYLVWSEKCDTCQVLWLLCNYTWAQFSNKGALSFTFINHAYILLIIIIILIFIYCNWVVTRWQWLFYMYTKYEIDF